MSPIRIAIVGFGKIARDQHVPAICRDGWRDAGRGREPQRVASGSAAFCHHRRIAARWPADRRGGVVHAPQVRRAQAAAALEAGKHVMLEKPPGASVSELEPLIRAAARAGRTLFATWHSRFAPAVEPARHRLAARHIRSVSISWKEANREAPIAARLSLADAEGLPIVAEFDFRQTEPQRWDILIETDGGPLTLSSGGARLVAGGEVLVDAAEAEYRGLYRRFVELTATGASDVDLTPLRLVADAFLLGRRQIVEPFED
jgi:D-galactose 1-dehydrogenase